MGLQFVTEPTVWLVAETEVNFGPVAAVLRRVGRGGNRPADSGPGRFGVPEVPG